MAIGIDEVGRGCWAGPLLVVAAWAHAELPSGLTDSKLLSKKRRQAILPAIRKACDFGEGWVTASEIDDLGLSQAMRLGVQRALQMLGANPADHIIMDGNINYCPYKFKNVECLVGADRTEPIVSAASIFAKVSRDIYMEQMAQQYPVYGFERHVGYGTKAHLQALGSNGVCRMHRRSFKPVKAFI